MKNLDFIVIGAQKCATTALFENLRNHPKIHMPLEKEVPFFSAQKYSEAAWPSYAQQHFGMQHDVLWGKATPQYLCDVNAPLRIKAMMPDVKLIVILRDPIERTWSHYQMARRRETEPRAFDTAIEELLHTQALNESGDLPVPTHESGYESEGEFYVSWSEYGRMLQRYTQLFDSSQILVLYSENLKRDPVGTLDSVLAYIGLEAGYRPEALGEVVHRGGGSNRIPNSLRVWLRQRRLLYRLWEVLPESRRGRLRFLYEQWNVRHEAAPEPRMSDATAARLRRHFASDLSVLQNLCAPSPPWLSRYTDS